MTSDLLIELVVFLSECRDGRLVVSDLVGLVELELIVLGLPLEASVTVFLSFFALDPQQFLEPLQLLLDRHAS